MKREKRTLRPSHHARPSIIARVRESMTPHVRLQLLLISLFTVSALSLLSLLGLAGAAGVFLFDVLSTVFGELKILFPIAVFGMALWAARSLVKTNEASFQWAQAIGSIFLLLTITAAWHFPIPLSESLIQAFAGNGGGLSGFFLAYSLQSVLGFWGGAIVLGALFLSALLLIVNTSFAEFFRFSRGVRMRIFGFLDFLKTCGRSAPHMRRMHSPVGDQDDETAYGVSPEFTKHSLPLAVSNEETSHTGGGDFSEKVVMEVLKPLKRKYKTQLALDLLQSKSSQPTSGDIKTNIVIVQKTLENFGIPVEMGEVNIGPTVTQYTLKPAEGIKLSALTALHNDLALALAAHPIRIEAPIPGRSLVGIEVPNQKTALVTLREVLESDEFKKRKDNLSIVLGKDVAGRPCLASIAQMPHLLIAGSTGSGKTVCINTIITSLLFQNGPDDVRFIMIDPKRVELPAYNDIPHLLTPVITDVKKAINALRWTVSEMERRFDLLSKHRKRDIASYNAHHGAESMPYIIVIIDELADIMVTAGVEAEALIIRLAQMARAVGIHLILATQRPSVDVITGLIKANITSRIAFAVASQMDSRTILDSAGADKLVGRGDMLYISSQLSKPVRLQGAYVSDIEIETVVNFLKEGSEPAYQDDVTEKQTFSGVPGIAGTDEDDDEFLAQARDIVMRAHKASASLLQRRLRIGYARAARLLDFLEAQGVIGPADGAKPREVLVSSPEEFDFAPKPERDEEVG